jgi:pseudomonalisin
VVLTGIAALWSAAYATATSTRGVRVDGVTPHVVASGQAHVHARMSSRQMLRLTLVLQPRRQDEFRRFLDKVVDPRSPQFRRFLTFQQWKARFGPRDSDVAAVNGFARSRGLSVIHTFRNNLGVKVQGTAATVERAFGVRLNYYSAGTRTFFSNDSDPLIPRALAGIVKNVQGLNGYFHIRPANPAFVITDDVAPTYSPGPFVRTDAFGRSASVGVRRAGGAALGTRAPQICCGISGSNIEAPDLFSSEAYDVNALQRFTVCCNPTQNPGGTPRETSIAIIGVNKVAESDITAFATQYGMAVNLSQVELNGPSCCNSEMTLDIESATAFANSFGSFANTAHIYAYEGGGTHISDHLDAWEEAHSRDQARVASTSFGAFEDHYGGLDPSISDFTDVINAMAAEGWTIIAASGDHGATDSCEGRSVSFPASSPFVLAAGGTTLALTNNAGAPRFSSEVAWNGTGCGGTDWPGQNMGGGGGGCASTEPAGFWQAIVPSLPCGNKRALPDIALNAGTGQEIFYGGWTLVGGRASSRPSSPASSPRSTPTCRSSGTPAERRSRTTARRWACPTR